MKVKRTGGVAGLIVVGTMALAACGSDNNAGTTSGGTSGGTSASPAAQVACASGALTGAGSSFQAPIQQQWVKDYSAKCAGTQINYQSVGSGAGIQQFTSGTVDFAGSDVALKPDEPAPVRAPDAQATCAAGLALVPPLVPLLVVPALLSLPQAARATVPTTIRPTTPPVRLTFTGVASSP